MKNRCLIFFGVAVVGFGCNRDDASGPSHPPVDSTIASESCAVVFVNNWPHSASHGCYSKVTSAETLEQELVCGEQGKASRLRYKWAGRGNFHDRYQLTWSLMTDVATVEQPLPLTTAIQKEVLFRGETIVAMENDQQRVVLYPCGQDHPPLVDSSTPRSP